MSKIVFITLSILTLSLGIFMVMPSDIKVENIDHGFNNSVVFAFLETEADGELPIESETTEVTPNNETSVTTATGSYAEDKYLIYFYAKHNEGDFLQVTSRWGARSGGAFSWHYGDDLQGQSSGRRPVSALSPGPGKVTNVRREISDSAGRTMTITDSRTGMEYVFMHLDSIAVEEGDLVNPGDPVGVMGTTGTQAWHIHFELRYPTDGDIETINHIKTHGQWKIYQGARNRISIDPRSNAVKWVASSKPGKFRFVLWASGDTRYNWVDVP